MSALRQHRGQEAPPEKVGPANGAPAKRKDTSPVKKQLYFAALAWAVAVAYVASRYGKVKPPLPEAYALCSPSGSHVYTVDATRPNAQCVVVEGAFFVDVGGLGSIKQRWAVSHEEELPVRFIKPGAVILPGLSDSHGHMLEYGASRLIPLESAKDSEEAVKLVHEYVLAHEDILKDEHKFIYGWGWDHTKWPNSRWPKAADFSADPLLKNRPIVLTGKDGHALWVSPTVVESMLPLPDTVEGGEIRRDASGAPTGVFIDNAQDLVKAPPLTQEDHVRRFMRTVTDAHSVGLTAVHDAGLDPASLEFFKRQTEKDPLPIRVYGMTYFDEDAPYWGDKVDRIIDNGTTRLTARSVKFFADGALRTGGAALYEPYTDNPDTTGFMRLSPEVLTNIVPRFLRDGWQVNIHAIGDRANGLVLDAFESALKDIDVATLRPRLEHAQIMTQKDMGRLGRLGVIASVQPTHVISDMWYAEERLGPERIKMLYAFRTMLDDGARITLGSDFPVEDMNPLSGFYAGITRLSPKGKSPKGNEPWFPEQRITRDEALRGMTIEPAYASFTENILGSIVPGKRADYVVLDQNIMTIPAEHILATKVLATVMDGRPVHGSV